MTLFTYGIEIGQLFLQDRIASNTDWFMQTLGGAIGYIGMLVIYPAFFSSHHIVPSH